MGRIVCQVAIENITNGRERLELSALRYGRVAAHTAESLERKIG